MTWDKSIGSASVRLSRKITRLINHALKSYHITTEQWGVLRTLHETDRITQKELSERADKDKATLTKILDLLEKHHFIERVMNPNDRRSFFITITAKGNQLCEEVAPFLNSIFEEILEPLDKEVIQRYQEGMQSLENRIDTLLEDKDN